MAPQIEFSKEGAPMLRPRLAAKVEEILAELAVHSFDSYPVTYAKGYGSLLFSEFVTPAGESQDRAVIFTQARDAADNRIAVCLFGSLSNFADRIVEAGPVSDRGWTSSAAPEVAKFLDSRCTAGFQSRVLGDLRKKDLAYYAFQVAYYQGGSFNEGDPWQRGFTYGDIQDSGEWFAEIYWDIQLQNIGEKTWDGFARILIGAPLWVRTPRPQALRLYNDFSAAERASLTTSRYISKLERAPKQFQILTNLRSWLARFG